VSSANAIAIRDAAFTRAVATGTWTTTRKIRMPTLNGADCPSLSVFMLRETGKPDGDANVAVPRFITTATLAISVMRGFDDPVVTEGLAENDAAVILDALLCDLTFVGVPPAGLGLFEGVTRIKSDFDIFAQQAETYFVETRLELDFEYHLYFAPPVIVPLQSIAVSLGGIFAPQELDYDLPADSEYLPGLNE
jgi:hypothetical protein